MTKILNVRVENNLSFRWTSRVNSTQTSGNVEFFDRVTGAFREPHADNRTNLMVVADKGSEDNPNPNYEIMIWGTVGAAVNGVSPISNILRNISFNGINFEANSPGKQHAAKSEGGCVELAQFWNGLMRVMAGIDATAGNNFRVGDETGSDISLIFQNDHTVKPRIFFDDSDGRQKLSWGDEAPASGDIDGLGVPFLTVAERDSINWPNNAPIIQMADGPDAGEHMRRTGGAWVALSSGGSFPFMSETVAGSGEIATPAERATAASLGGSGARLLVSNDALVKTPSGPADENKIVVLGADGKIAQGFLPDSTSDTIEAGENLSAGNALRIKLNGKAYKALKDAKVGVFQEIEEAGSEGDAFATVQIDTDKFVHVYKIANILEARVGIVDGDRITWGSSQTIPFEENTTDTTIGICKIATDKFAVVGRGTVTADAYIVICSVSGSTITAGTWVEFESGNMADSNGIFKVVSTGTNKGCIVWADDASSDIINARAFTVVGTVPTLGTEVTIANITNSGNNFDVCSPDTDKIAVFHYGTGADLYCTVATISGTTITVGTNTEIHDGITLGQGQGIMAAAKLTTDQAVCLYRDTGANIGYIIHVSISGTVPTAGTPVQVSSINTSANMLAQQVEDSKVIIAYEADQTTASTINFRLRVAFVTVTATVPKVHDFADLDNLITGSIALTNNNPSHSSLTVLSSDRFFVGILDVTNKDTYGVLLADNNFIGFANANVTSGNQAAVNFIEDPNQSSLVAGAQYYLASNGSISLQGKVRVGTAFSATKIIRN